MKRIATAVGVLGIGLGILLLATPLVTHAGGIIKGKVFYSGKPEEKEFLFSKFPNANFCVKNPHKELVKGEKRILPTIRVGPDGGLLAAWSYPCATSRTKPSWTDSRAPTISLSFASGFRLLV